MTGQKIIAMAHEDPEETRLSFEMTGDTKTIPVVSVNGVPTIVLALCEKVNEEPLYWTVEDDHVSFVAKSGRKYRFDKEPH